uniref:Uncharacterized protein n=1 Tax=Electrophorus electricus TaxID=8005 RepID=A0A4W4G111_ELEEL
MGAPEWVAQAHCISNALHLLLVAAPVIHGTLFGVLQCRLQSACCAGSSPPPPGSSGHNSPLRQRFSSASSLCIVSRNTLFFSFSFSYFLFHCSAVSSRFIEAEFLIVLALRVRETERRGDRIKGRERGRTRERDRQKESESKAARKGE